MRSFSAFFLLLVTVGCDDTVVVQLRSGPQEVEVGATALSLPTQLRDDASGTPRIASVPCGPMGMCPSSASIAITCEAGVCDPAPVSIAVPAGDVVDFDVLAADARSLIRQVDAIEVIEGTYVIRENTLSIDTPEIEVFWGPAGATTVDPGMGVVALGTLPPIAARSTEPGALVLDPAGVAALSDYLVGTSRQVRFFARTRVDLAPGGAFPEGHLVLAVDMTVRITGSVVR